MLPLFALTIFLGAALLFLLEPMVARMALPLLGGSPAVWNTCMLFFQAALLAGYALAHASARRLTPPLQAALQAVLLLLPLAVLPVAMRGQPDATAPVLWLLIALTAAAGLPFLVVAGAGPMLQHWFADPGRRAPPARDPYILYAASNAGSLLALLVYPVLVEPHLTLSQQSRWWAAAYLAFGGLCLLCAGLTVWSARARAPSQPAPARPAETSAARPTTRDRLWWVLLAFIPSSLTLGATQFLSTDIAAVPLLWVVPLALYLLTFVIAFGGGGRPPPTALFARLLPMGALGLAVAALIQAQRPAWVLVSLHLATLTVAALLCHTRLAQRRPHPSRLTEFYLLIALGGALGGVFNALLAPLLFNSILEYPIALALALLIRPRLPSRFDTLPRWVLVLADFAAPILIGGLGLWLDDYVQDRSETFRLAVTIGVPALLCYLLSPRPVGFALGVAAMSALAAFVPKDGQRLHRERTFFGVYTVGQSQMFTTLTHGTTVHGLQYRLDPFRQIPLGYYHPEGPIGQVFKSYRDARAPDGRPVLDRLGLVGMGTGALAAYGRPGQRITFHEIDPAVVAIASDPRYFTYLASCRASWDVALGDGRLTLAAAPDGEYGLLVLDAFSSDSIPLHLLTLEAAELYLKKLRPGGLVAFHISNQYLNLEPVLAAIADRLSLAALAKTDDVLTSIQHEKGRYSSQWVVLARSPADLAPLARDVMWHAPQRDPRVPLWTDGFSNIWSVFRWN